MSKLETIISSIERIDFSLGESTQKRLDNLTKPKGSLGRLEGLAKQVVEITQQEKPSLKNKVIFTLAGDHGVAVEGVSAFPQEVTSQMVGNFIAGGAGINVLARHAGARVVVADFGVACDLKPCDNLIVKKVNYSTQNMMQGPAMTLQEAVKAIENGITLFEEEYDKGIDIIGTGDMGIGNTTSSSAITSVITGKSVDLVTGRGTGIDNTALLNKISVINKSIEVNQPNKSDAVDVLAKVGGFEIGGLVGVMLAAASKRVPIVIDGFISAAAALIAYQLEPKIKDYFIAAHASVEQGHKIIFDYLGLKAIFDLQLCLGEGTGTPLAMNIIEAGIKILTEMATFESASVSEQNS